MSDEDLTDDQRLLLRVVKGSVPANANDVAVALGKLSKEMYKAGLELDAADEECTDLIEEHGREYDKAFLAAGFDPQNPSKHVTEEVRKAIARDKTWEMRLRMEQKKREVRKLKRRIDTLERRIFAGQSIAKTVRSEHRTIGYGQWGA